MIIEDAVKILISDDPARYLFEREFAVASFAGWINSPQDQTASVSTIFTALNRAVIFAKKNNITPPTEWLTEIFDPEFYLSSLESALYTPIFWSIEEYEGYNDCRYSADIVRFLLTFRSKHHDKRKRSSLGKAWEFINKHGGFLRGDFGFSRKEWCSISKHQIIWRDYKQSSPFQCARYNGSKFNWYIDPRSEDFLKNLIEVAARRKELVDYFRSSLDIQNRMKAVVDPRSMATKDYFNLPASLTPLHCRLPVMTASAYGKMAAYRRGSNLTALDSDY